MSQITCWFVTDINIETMEKEREAKLKALQLTMDKLEKTYGKGSVMKMGDVVAEDIACIPTGSLGLDLALGIGGYPKGRVVEIYGPESSCKTTSPRTVDLYDVFCGILYVLKSGCQWRMLPANFPKWRTCNEYFRIWSEKKNGEDSILDQVLKKTCPKG